MLGLHVLLPCFSGGLSAHWGCGDVT